MLEEFQAAAKMPIQTRLRSILLSVRYFGSIFLLLLYISVGVVLSDTAVSSWATLLQSYAQGIPRARTRTRGVSYGDINNIPLVVILRAIPRARVRIRVRGLLINQCYQHTRLRLSNRARVRTRERCLAQFDCQGRQPRRFAAPKAAKRPSCKTPLNAL